MPFKLLQDAFKHAGLPALPWLDKLLEEVGVGELSFGVQPRPKPTGDFLAALAGVRADLVDLPNALAAVSAAKPEEAGEPE
jgi:hypothetical protein